MTSQAEDAGQRDELDLDAEEIRDIDVNERAMDEVRGGNSYGPKNPAPTH
jgi:hypothetical protein